MKEKFNPKSNYLASRNKVGYVKRVDATQDDYNRLGFMSGLEVHQQLLTQKKLFCHCPAGVFNDDDDYDAELLRHMRPTLSELGEYDGTALMEFRTRKNITYRIKNATTCTYEVDDTPPFPINREALQEAIEISLLSKLNIVGEVHITRKQYLDGSIPAGFQRTAIIGVEGEIALKNKKVRLIQLSIEEDSCREVSDIGHERIYKTDRLGMPLIETVTYPDFVNPDEVKEGCDYIRFLNRSTAKVRTGMGAGRQDVNVSCRNGSRVEIKGVAHTKWIPELAHNEVYRQWALLQIKEELNRRISSKKKWKVRTLLLTQEEFKSNIFFKEVSKNNRQIVAVLLPHFYQLLSYFVQPGKVFANEFSERLKVIACLDQPNMTHSEDINPILSEKEIQYIFKALKATKEDAFILFYAPKEDVKTAIETIEERALIAFDGVPEETRKSFADGTTIFERVLPGADRMYPDTDSAPIPLTEDYIERLREGLPDDIIVRYKQLQDWNVAEDTFTYIFSKNLYPLLQRMVEKTNFSPKLLGNFLGHRLKFIEGKYTLNSDFEYKQIGELVEFIEQNKLDFSIAELMLAELIQHPKMDFDSILNVINFTSVEEKVLLEQIPFLRDKYKIVGRKQDEELEHKWIMSQLHQMAVGNISLSTLSNIVKEN